MVDYSGAINDLRFFENRLKNILEVIPALSELGSLENAVTEAKKQIEDLKSDIASLGKDKADAEDALKAAVETLDNRKADFDDWHRNEVDKVNEESKLLLKDAQNKALSIVSTAQDKADKISTATVLAKSDLERLYAQVDEAKAQYDAITSKLLSIKNSI